MFDNTERKWGSEDLATPSSRPESRPRSAPERGAPPDQAGKRNACVSPRNDSHKIPRARNPSNHRPCRRGALHQVRQPRRLPVHGQTPRPRRSRPPLECPSRDRRGHSGLSASIVTTASAARAPGDNLTIRLRSTVDRASLTHRGDNRLVQLRRIRSCPRSTSEHPDGFSTKTRSCSPSLRADELHVDQRQTPAQTESVVSSLLAPATELHLELLAVAAPVRRQDCW